MLKIAEGAAAALRAYIYTAFTCSSIQPISAAENLQGHAVCIKVPQQPLQRHTAEATLAYRLYVRVNAVL